MKIFLKNLIDFTNLLNKLREIKVIQIAEELVQNRIFILLILKNTYMVCPSDFYGIKYKL